MQFYLAYLWVIDINVKLETKNNKKPINTDLTGI